MASQRLLMVDDEPEIGVLVKKIAEGLDGYEICFTHRADAFQAAYRSFHPHVIILDLAIPDIDGVELLKFLAGESCRAHILLLSGLDKKMCNVVLNLGVARGLNMAGFVLKPVRAAELRSILADLKEEGK